MVDEFDPDERFVLADAVEDFGAFTLLAWLGSPQHQPRRAADAVERLLERGLVAIEKSYDFNPGQPRTLSREEALRAIGDARKWRDPKSEPFEPDERYYVVVPTEKGRAWERARLEPA